MMTLCDSGEIINLHKSGNTFDLRVKMDSSSDLSYMEGCIKKVFDGNGYNIEYSEIDRDVIVINAIKI